MAGIEPASEGLCRRISIQGVGVFGALAPPVPADRERDGPAAGARERLSRTLSGVVCATPALCRLDRAGGGRRGGRVLLQEDWLPAYCFRQRAGEPQSQCAWHLVCCADFTSSAPLGLPFASVHPRQSHSSPWRVYHRARAGASATAAFERSFTGGTAPSHKGFTLLP